MNGLSSEARELLRTARSFDEPSMADARRVRASVFAKVGVAVGAGAALTAATQSIAASPMAALGATVTKLGAALVIAGGLATASYVALRAPSAKPVPAEVAESRVPHMAPQKVAPAVVPSVVSESEPRVEVPAPPPAKSVRARPADRTARAPRTTADLEGEARLLEQADADLRRGDANAALARLAEHAAKYPTGALREEREGIRVVALCRAGREEGKLAAQRFLARSPRSALATRIRVVCGE